MTVSSEKPVRKEIWNFKDKESQNVFKIQTSETKEFSKCFENNLPLFEQIENWRKVLKTHCNQAFKKIRIKKKKSMKPICPTMSELIEKRTNET